MNNLHMSGNVSLLVGLKNNLDYSIHFYETTRSIYKEVEIVFVSYNSTDGTHQWLDSLNDPNLVYFYTDEEKTFSHTFNKCAELATKEIIVYTHNDMVLTPGFVENIEKYITNKHVVCYTTIEPSIFADDVRPGKVIQDFGNDIQSFDLEALYAFSRSYSSEHAGGTNNEQRGTFFLAIKRNILLTIGGLDPLYNPMFCEDDDLLLRLKLYGMTIVTTMDAICYHFVSKTSRFSAEYESRTKIIELNSNRNFVRKWGFGVSSSIKKKYNMGLILENGSADLLFKLEPYFTSIYTNTNATTYLQSEQKLTSINIGSKIMPRNSAIINDIIVYLDGRKFTDRTYEKIKIMPELIDNQLSRNFSLFDRLLGKSNKRINWKMLKVDILDTKTYENELVINSDRDRIVNI